MVSRPGLDPVTLDVYDVYIIKGSWCGAKGQGPAIDRLCYVLGFKSSPIEYRGRAAHIKFQHHVNMHL